MGIGQGMRGRSAPNFVNLVGQVFNNRKVIERLPTPIYRGRSGSSRWRLECLLCGRISDSQTCGVKNSNCICQNSEGAKRSGKTRRKPLPLTESRNTYYLKCKFNLTEDQFQEMIKQQDGKCKICKRTFTRTPHVDHDHKCCKGQKSCGKCIRGLLCHNCNTALGNFNDDSDLLIRALAYLKPNKSIYRMVYKARTRIDIPIGRNNKSI